MDLERQTAGFSATEIAETKVDADVLRLLEKYGVTTPERELMSRADAKYGETLQA